MARKYTPDLWDIDHLLDLTDFGAQVECVEFIEGQLADFDDRNEIEHAGNYVQPVRFSFLISLVSHMEHQLKLLCDVIAEKRNLNVHVSDLRGANGFESCLSYLTKVLQLEVPESDVKGAREIVQMRNRCVHDGGYDETGQRIEFADGFIPKAAARCENLVRTVGKKARQQSTAWMKGKRR